MKAAFLHLYSRVRMILDIRSHMLILFLTLAATMVLSYIIFLLVLGEKAMYENNMRETAYLAGFITWWAVFITHEIWTFRKK
ncbi:MAG TPA: hypothetical protein VF868_15900 [Bacteroidia bacterium]|jgi:hypothetical protein